jgi:hypothetical protein
MVCFSYFPSDIPKNHWLVRTVRIRKRTLGVAGILRNTGTMQIWLPPIKEQRKTTRMAGCPAPVTFLIMSSTFPHSPFVVIFF